MTLWVAVIIACTNAAAISCGPVVSPRTYITEQECLDDTQKALDYFFAKGLMVRGACHAVTSGEAI